jgi:hypothetical protein
MASDSALTVAALRALCKDKELASSGKKAELVERLLKYGASREEVGLEPLEEEEVDIIVDDEGELILDEEENISTDSDEASKDSIDEAKEDDVLEAEVFVAEVIDDDIIEADVIEEDVVKEVDIESSKDATASASRFESSSLDMKKSAALAVTLILLAAGAWWWFSLDAEPFTPDPLRHGDKMGFAVTGGQLVATDDYASQIFQWFGSDDEICGLNVQFSGSGSVSITEGDRSDISGEMNDDRLGSVKQIGGNGFSWLTMERNLNYDFDDVDIAQSEVSSTLGCIEMPSVSARLGIDWKEWIELSSENSIRSEFGYELVHPDGQLQGDITTFGLNGFLDSLDSIGLGASMVFSPLQLHEVLGNTMIDEEAAGNVSGWSWQVTGSEDVGEEVAWKILFRNKDIEDNCLGHATIHILAVPSSPWAIRQSIDLLISGDDSSDCGTWQEILGDYAMPDGRLEMKMTIERTSLSRGENLVDLGYSYDSKPDISSLRPPSSEMADWGSTERHAPDLSSIRNQPLEIAISCIGNTSGGGNEAEVNLQDHDAYIWRARDDRSSQDKTRWNMSWLANDDASGWLVVDVAGQGGSEENCTYIDSGLLDEAPDHNRQAIPETVSLRWMEESRWLEEGKFPELSGTNGLAASSGKWNDDLKIGILVATAGVNLPDTFDFLPLGDAGRVTIDGVRSWDEGEWAHTFSFLADASDGKMIGWTHTRSSD